MSYLRHLLRTGVLFLLLLYTQPGYSLLDEGLRTITVPYYSETVTITYAADFECSVSDELPELAVPRFYQALKGARYELLVRELLDRRARYKLGDWHFFQLLRAVVDEIYAAHPLSTRELVCWFLLNESGYDSRLTYHSSTYFINVYVEEEVFEVPLIEDEGRTYANLSGFLNGQQFQRSLYMLDLKPGRGGQAFSFGLEELPHLKAKVKPVRVSFSYLEEAFVLDLQIDQTVRDIMVYYPFIEEARYVETPLSSTLRRSLLPQLRRILKGRSTRESVELLVSLTRSGFVYKEDNLAYGRSKPMIAEEVFHYPYSDCEDRTALLYTLIKELLDLPMIVLAYPDHLTLAVAIDNAHGSVVRYQGRDYLYSDPTGPEDSSEIGYIPEAYVYRDFEVVHAYK